MALRHPKVEVHWRTLHGAAWEQFVGEVFRSKGYWVKQVTGDQDDGIDLIATCDDQRIGIQCKGGVESIGAAAVQQALAGQAIHQCNRAAVVTNGAFSDQAKKLAIAADCWLVDATEFAQLAGERRHVVKRRSGLTVAKLCMGSWNLLVRLFGITLAVVLLSLGVLGIGALTIFFVSQLDLASPPHQQPDIPELQPASPTTSERPSPQLAADKSQETQPRPPSSEDVYAVPTAERTAEAAAARNRPEKARAWTSADGEFSVMAVYLGYEEGHVSLRRTDNNEIITVSLERLSDIDKKIVASRLRRARLQERKRAAAQQPEQ